MGFVPIGWVTTVRISIVLALGLSPCANAQVVLPGNDDSYAADMSPDARFVAFASVASNLAPGDTNGAADIFWFDRTLGIVRRVSESGDGVQGNGASTGPAVSADGRYVAFSSSASNLVAGDTNLAAELFVKDMLTGVVERMNRTPAGGYPGGGLLSGDGRASMSHDGATIVYQSANNFTSDPANNPGCKLYAVSRATAVSTLLVRIPGTDAFYSCSSPRLSGDGNFVTFVSTVDGLVPNDSNGQNDTFRLRVSDRTLQLVSVALSGSSGNGTSGNWHNAYPVPSDDGRYVLFRSSTPGLVASETDGNDLYVRDMTGGVTSEVKTKLITGSGTVSYGPEQLGISPDGRYVSFNGYYALPGGTTQGMLLFDRVANTVGLLGPQGFAGDTDSFSLPGSVWSADNTTFLLTTTSAYAALNDSGQSSDVIQLTRTSGALTLASRATEGRVGDGHSRSVTISDTGERIAFSSHASNLVAGDNNNSRDVFVRSTNPESLMLASSSAAGVPGNDDSNWPAISRDGNHVGFISSASNLVPGDTNGQQDVFVKSLATGAIERVTNGGAIDYALAVSGDARYVAFATVDATLTGHDPSEFGAQYVVYDRTLDVARLASRTPAGAPTFSSVNLPGCPLIDGPLALSADGRYLMFNSFRPDIIGLPIDQRRDRVFVFDYVTGVVTQVDVGASQAFGCGGGISADGQRIAFYSNSSLDVTRPGFGAYVRDRAAGTTRLVLNLSSAPFAGTDGQPPPVIDPSGRYVLLPSARAGIEAGDTNQLRDVFLVDTTNGRATRESLTASWGQANGASAARDSLTTAFGQNIPFYRGIALSNLASRVAFASAASNLTVRDDNASDDIFVVERATKAIRRVSAPPQSITDADRKEPAASADARNVVMVATSDDAPAGKAIGDKFSQTIVVDWDTGVAEPIDVSTGGLRGNGSSKFPSISPLGNFVAFASDADNLSPAPDVNSSTDVFVRDRVTGTTHAVTQGANSDCGRTAVAQIGNKFRAAFECAATNLGPTPDTNGVQDVFVATQDAGIERVSVDSSENAANGPSSQPSVSSNGRFVAFSSLANNLVPSDNNGVSDIFVRDLVGGTTVIAALGIGGAKPDGASGAAHIVPIGTGTAWLAAYESEATNLVANDVNGQTDIFVATSAGSLELVTKGVGGAPANDRSFAPSVSPDGRYVTFSSLASNLIPNDTNRRPDVFMYDRVDNTMQIISVNNAGEQANDFPLRPAIGQRNGRPLVVWDTPASNLAANDTDNAIDVFRRDTDANETTPMPFLSDLLFEAGFE